MRLSLSERPSVVDLDSVGLPAPPFFRNALTGLTLLDRI